jgi:hypothetical protein
VRLWERYPTQLDLTELAKDEGAITVWVYSPLAEPLDTAPYHDGLRLDSYKKQLEALDVTYEDYEPDFATANGIGRTNQFFLKPYLKTPSNAEFASFSSMVRRPSRLVPTAEHMHSTDVFHGCWAPDYRTLGYSPTQKELNIEKTLIGGSTTTSGKSSSTDGMDFGITGMFNILTIRIGMRGDTM